MSKKCIRTLKRDTKDVAMFNDSDILRALRAHADPKWWQEESVRTYNQAFLRRWAATVRRDARRRGLL